jgi:hypothetical protein
MIGQKRVDSRRFIDVLVSVSTIQRAHWQKIIKVAVVLCPSFRLLFVLRKMPESGQGRRFGVDSGGAQ